MLSFCRRPPSRAALNSSGRADRQLPSTTFGGTNEELTLGLQFYKIKPRGTGVWEGEATYGRRLIRKTGDIVFTFDGTAGTQHIQVSKGTTIYSPPGTPNNLIPDFKNAIGVTDNGVAGCDISIPIYKFTYEYYAAVDDVTDDYINTLTQDLAASVNDGPWKGFDEGEVLYLGASGQQRNLDDWQILLHFMASPNIVIDSIGDIKSIDKEGQQYLWVRFAPRTSNNNPVLEPQFVSVEDVYDKNNFFQLGIGN